MRKWIPEGLKYEETALFGMTLREIAWTVLPALVGAALFFKIGLEAVTGSKVAYTVVGCLAVSGWFLGKQKKDEEFLKWLRFSLLRRKRFGRDSPEAARFLGIKEFGEDYVEMNDGRILGVLRVLGSIMGSFLKI